jgi:uncharacterized iron-regulated membrane protein
MSFDDDRPVVNVTTGPRPDAGEGEMHFASFDRTSGEIVPPVAGGGVMDFILKLHTDMFLGLPGYLFLGFMGLLLVASLVSGVVVYTPFMRKLDFATVRTARSNRLKWLDLHNVLGIVTLAWVLVVGATGVINTLAIPILGLWQNGQLAEMTAPYKDLPPLTELGSLHKAMQTAQAAAPGMAPSFVAGSSGSPGASSPCTPGWCAPTVPASTGRSSSPRATAASGRCSPRAS